MTLLFLGGKLIPWPIYYCWQSSHKAAKQRYDIEKVCYDHMLLPLKLKYRFMVVGSTGKGTMQPQCELLVNLHIFQKWHLCWFNNSTLYNHNYNIHLANNQQASYIKSTSVHLQIIVPWAVLKFCTIYYVVIFILYTLANNAMQLPTAGAVLRLKEKKKHQIIFEHIKYL